MQFGPSFEKNHMKSIRNMSHLRILVVDDEPFQQRMLRDVLKYMDFRGTMEADSGVTAISLLDDQRVDLILGDVQMPGMNGLELLRHIRTGQTYIPRDLPFIVLTSHSDTEVLSAAMALDVSGFIVKSFKTGIILDKITRALGQQLILRSDSDYGSVVTDLASLRRARHKVEPNPTDSVAAAAAGHGRHLQVEIPLAELRVGMRVAKNIKAKDDTVILAAETSLTEATIHLLSDLSELLSGGIVTVYHPAPETKAQQ
jgi:CheY-like chemotaxis protein